MTTYADAKAELEALGADLVVTDEYAYSETVEEGHVISQDPPGGTLVAPGSTVVLTVSLGPRPATRWTGATVGGVPIHETAANQQQVVPVVFVHLDIEGSPLYLNNSNCNFEWDGQTWLGAGQMGDIEAISEAQDLIAQPVSLTLSGVDADVVTDAMDANYKGRDVVIYLALVHPDTLALQDDPEEIWSGFMDVMKLEIGQNHGQIGLTCEHWLRIAPVISLYTDQEQQVIESGDRFFQFTKDIPNYVGDWGGKPQGYGTGGGGSGGRNPRGPRNHH
jgi:hypothetical protein